MVTGLGPGEPPTSALPSYGERKGSPGPEEAEPTPPPPQPPQLFSSLTRQAHHPRERLITGCQVPWGQTNEAASLLPASSEALALSPTPPHLLPSLLSFSETSHPPHQSSQA